MTPGRGRNAGGIVVVALLAAFLGSAAGTAATWWLLSRAAVDRVAQATTPTAPPTGAVAPTANVPPSPSPPPTLAPSPTVTLSPSPAPTPTPPPTLTPGLAERVEQISASVVTIINSRDTSGRRKPELSELVWGSGVIVDARGYVLTNQHVAAGATELIVALSDGRNAPGRYIAGDDGADLALIKIEGGEGYPVLLWGESSSLRPGDNVAVVGSPLGNLPNSVTTGVVSGVRRAVVLEDGKEMADLIQTDAAINHGNSGGALLDDHGRLVGIVTLLIRELLVPPQDADVQGVGFAIPSALAQPLADEWIALDAP